MTDKNYMKRRFKCRCYQKDNTVKIYDGSEILFDVSYRDFDDAFYLSRKLQSVIMELNELHEENERLKQNIDELLSVNVEEELLKENEQLKEEIQFLFNQIKAFREDCRTYQDFDGASTLNRLIEILEQSKEIFE